MQSISWIDIYHRVLKIKSTYALLIFIFIKLDSEDIIFIIKNIQMRYKMFGLLFKAFNLYTDQDTKLINSFI